MKTSLFDCSNLFAWCVASHDPPERSARERMQMLRKLGFTQYAWGNRMAGPEHLGRLDEELTTMEECGIRLIARWLPSRFQPDQVLPVLDHLESRRIQPDLWLTGAGEPATNAREQEQRLAGEVERIRPFAKEALRRGFSIALYNHDKWFGNPLNRLALIDRLAGEGFRNIGLVQSLHWSHEYLDCFNEMLEAMKPHLRAIILSGIFRNGRATGRHIVPIGAGPEDLRILRMIADSGWQGPMGIINHTEQPASLRLKDNLDGLKWAVSAALENNATTPPDFKTFSRNFSDQPT